MKIASRGEDKNDLNTEGRALGTAFGVVAASTLETCFVLSLLKKYNPLDLMTQSYSFVRALTCSYQMFLSGALKEICGIDCLKWFE